MRTHIHRERKEIALHMSLNEGVTNRDICRFTGISQRAMKRLRKTFRETGEVVRNPVTNGRPRMLDSLDADFLEGCVERQPDIMLSELQDHLRKVCNVEASTVTISRTLHRRGFTLKKVTRPAIERDENDCAIYKMIIGEYFLPQHLVFADESHFNRLSMRRPYAWAPRGNRARRRDFFIRGQKYSILPALCLDRILHLEVQDHSFNGDEFTNFIKGVLDRMQPRPLPNSVLVMDNASIHKVPGIREMIEARGMRLKYPPAHPPDPNPIEEAFSTIGLAYIRTLKIALRLYMFFFGLALSF